MLNVLFDGVAYGMLLFVLALGLSVTLGLMNFANLAHGAFGMAGGYVCVLLLNRWGAPFWLALAAAFLGTALLGALLERALYRRLYGAGHFDQVLFSLGLVFVSMSVANYVMGAQQQLIRLPGALTGRTDLGFMQVGTYRLVLILLCGGLALALQFALIRTRFGTRLRAAVDDARVARGLGIPVDRIFAATFAAGSGLAGLGGALGVEILGLDPTFPVKFMIYVLIVVTVGGIGSIVGPLAASLVLGCLDVAGKYYAPAIGAFVIYAAMVAILILRPQGLFARAAE